MITGISLTNALTLVLIASVCLNVAFVLSYIGKREDGGSDE